MTALGPASGRALDLGPWEVEECGAFGAHSTLQRCNGHWPLASTAGPLPRPPDDDPEQQGEAWRRGHGHDRELLGCTVCGTMAQASCKRRCIVLTVMTMTAALTRLGPWATGGIGPQGV